MLEHLRLCLVTNLGNQLFSSYLPFIKQAVRGGVTCVQLREKNVYTENLRDTAFQLKRFLDIHAIPLIINDDVGLAREIDAAGVHLGQTDLEPRMARKLLGPDKIIGLSIETEAELTRANQLDCLSYVAASAVFPSKTKPDTKTIWGLQGLQKITQNSIYPVMAIGGITQHNIKDVMLSGACGVAVIGALHDHPTPAVAAANLKASIDQWIVEETSCCRM